MTAAHLLRRQITLFVPDPERARVDSIRQRFNPVQYGLIAAHVTLCRDDEVGKWDELQDRARSISSVEVSLHFGKPVRYDNFVELPVVGETVEFDDLRRQVLNDRDCRKQEPHITLIHPRNGRCCDSHFSAIQDLLNEELVISFRALTFIEQKKGQPWSSLCSFPVVMQNGDSVE